MENIKKEKNDIEIIANSLIEIANCLSEINEKIPSLQISGVRLSDCSKALTENANILKEKISL